MNLPVAPRSSDVGPESVTVGQTGTVTTVLEALCVADPRKLTVS